MSLNQVETLLTERDYHPFMGDSVAFLRGSSYGWAFQVQQDMSGKCNCRRLLFQIQFLKGNNFKTFFQSIKGILQSSKVVLHHV